MGRITSEYCDVGVLDALSDDEFACVSGRERTLSRSVSEPDWTWLLEKRDWKESGRPTEERRDDEESRDEDACGAEEGVSAADLVDLGGTGELLRDMDVSLSSICRDKSPAPYTLRARRDTNLLFTMRLRCVRLLTRCKADRLSPGAGPVDCLRWWLNLAVESSSFSLSFMSSSSKGFELWVWRVSERAP